MKGQRYAPSLMEFSAKKEQRQDARCQAPSGRDRLFCATVSAPVVYLPKLAATEPHSLAYRPRAACKHNLFLHWRVEEYDSDVVDTAPKTRRRAFDPDAALETSIRATFSSGVIVCWSSRFPLDGSDLHGDQTFSCFLASVVVQPLCADELLPDSIAVRNHVEDMEVHHLLRFDLATSTFSRRTSMPVLLSCTSFPESSS